MDTAYLGNPTELTVEKLEEAYKILKPIGDRITTHVRCDDFHYYQILPQIPKKVWSGGVLSTIAFIAGAPVYHDRRVKGMLFYRKDGTRERFIHPASEAFKIRFVHPMASIMPLPIRNFGMLKT